MRDPLLDSLAALFDEIDPAPEVPAPRPTGYAPMELEPVRGTPRELSFQHGLMRLSIDGTRLVGLVPPDSTVHIDQVTSSAQHQADADGWFRADITQGPLRVSLPDEGLTTGWLIA